MLGGRAAQPPTAYEHHNYNFTFEYLVFHGFCVSPINTTAYIQAPVTTLKMNHLPQAWGRVCSPPASNNSSTNAS
jgi:hypothetical protein